jgi:hypothetical protein
MRVTCRAARFAICAPRAKQPSRGGVKPHNQPAAPARQPGPHAAASSPTVPEIASAREPPAEAALMNVRFGPNVSCIYDSDLPCARIRDVASLTAHPANSHEYEKASADQHERSRFRDTRSNKRLEGIYCRSTAINHLCIASGIAGGKGADDENA